MTLLLSVSCNESRKIYIPKAIVQTKAYYGFIVYNENGTYFYKIEGKNVQQYIERDVNDTNVINKLISKTKYVYSYGGKSIDYYAWRSYEKLFLEKENQLIEIDIPTCTKLLKSKVIPVLIVSQDIDSELVSEIDECNKFLNKKLLNKPELIIMFINPLDIKKAKNYRHIRDSISLSSKDYEDFYKSSGH